MVPWVRVMASLHWAALRYCRITEQLIETNDSNNGTLSPQAGFVVGLISVAVAARRTRHHADPSEEGRRSSLFKRAVGDFYTSGVYVCASVCVPPSKTAVMNVNNPLTNLTATPTAYRMFLHLPFS